MSKDPYALVTGGAGFVGSHLAEALLQLGRPVVLLDSLARSGVERNARGLVERYGTRVQLMTGDVRDGATVEQAVSGADEIFHLAAQVAVTSSLQDPREDFEANALGTLNVLEAARCSPRRPSVIFTSTNKVYGALDDVELVREGRQWRPAAPELAAHGVPEARPLDFCSPYGCSKGAADQYVLDYARSYGLRACVLRMSCIYGPRQFGTEDQGWIAHFLFRAHRGEALTIYGDGLQVRDALFVADLMKAFLRARTSLDRLGGRAWNLGGGPRHATSLLELVERLETRLGRRIPVEHADWRVGDQRWYVSDTRAFEAATGWSALTGLDEGLGYLADWVGSQQLDPAV